MEIYSDFCGQCVPMLATIRKIKMEIGTEIISMAKACADEIEPLKRFKCKSEPAYLFISKGMVTRVMFGADGIRLNEIVIEELALEEKEKSSNFKRPRFEFSDRTREEEEHTILEAEHQKLVLAKRKRIAEARQASRKRRVCERLAMGAPILNFIIFFPHCHQAHYDLYEKWDPLNLTVFGKEEVQLTEETIAEAFYQSDVDLNEACVHELLGGPVLVILFKAMETDTRDLVKLMRHVLYEEIQEVDPEQPSDEQSQMTAYQMYGITSKTREEVLHERWEQQQELKKNQREERKRLREESKRLAQEAEEERILMEKKRAEEERIARLQAGAAGGAASGPEADPEPESAPAQGEQGEEGEAAIEEENPEDVPGVEYGGSDQESEEFYYEKENDEDEYIPPGNLYIPGFYSPPNHLARANGIALFFPKLTEKFSDIESEFLPPHILMLYPIDKRHEIQETIIDFKDEVLQVGIFTGIPPEKPEFVAYSVKQYDKMHTLPDPNECMALMVSRKRSLPLLTLAGLGPIHISMDVAHGELECAELFPVGYGDDFEEEETIVEEEEIE